MAVVYWGFSFGIKGSHQPILAMAARTIIIYDIDDNMNEVAALDAVRFNISHPPDRARMLSACAA